jgi:2-polyprenyl-3-methyl-5-hydroxy-6-metoxy-1,4-benzoquinol methylase
MARALGHPPTQTLVGAPAEVPLHIDPDELRSLAAPDSSLRMRILGEVVKHGAAVTEVAFLTEVHRGQEIWMHGEIARPIEPSEPLTPVLLIPGGRGTLPLDFTAWLAQKVGVLVLGVDWIGVGRSSMIEGLDPWANAFRFDGNDIRASFQMHNLRGFLQATEVLLGQSGIDPTRLTAMGSSWGGFYSLLIGGIDPRFRALSVDYGCGFLELGCRRLWQAYMASMPPADVDLWLKTFDPGRRAHLVTADVFYAQATNDRYFSLEGTMRTYHSLRGEKRLLLVRNQDHSLHPYDTVPIAVLREVAAGATLASFPQVGCSWVAGTTEVEVSVDGDVDGPVEVVYSAGSYAPWSARRWRAVAATRDGSRWVAEIPVVDQARQIWFYGHVEHHEGRATSSPVVAVSPVELGVRQATAAPVPGFDFAVESFWNLPIGDRSNPKLSQVDDAGLTGLSICFDESDEQRAVAYCLEGDLIESGGFDEVELLVKPGEATDRSRFQLVVLTDYNTLDEQAYGVPLSSLGLEAGTWTRVRLGISSLRSYTDRLYNTFAMPETRPLEVGRICAIGFRRDDLNVSGEVSMADIRLLHGADVIASGPMVAAESPLAPPSPSPLTELRIETSLPADELRERLRQWEPWRYEIVFSNGVRTGEFARGPMFVERPLDKWDQAAPYLPVDELRGGTALDVGSNIGHYSLFLARELGMRVTGLETNKRNLSVAHFLAQTAGVDGVEFVDADASHWHGASGLDLVLHFGTLDHLRHPLLALENSAAMLRPDGYLALELQTLARDDDKRLCRYVGPSQETTCWWFLGRGALHQMLADAGFDRIRTVVEWTNPELLGDEMARTLLVARRAST